MSRQLPSAPEAEACVLGTILLYPNAARTAIDAGLVAEDFFVEANQNIYKAINALYNRGKNTMPADVATQLKDMKLLDRSGGFNYLTELQKAAVAEKSLINYANTVHDKSIVRKMIAAAQEVVEGGLQGQDDANNYLDFAEKHILDISRERRTSEFKPSSTIMSSVLENIRSMSDNKSDITGLKTGFTDLDHVLHGLQRGDFIVLAARPSMGKTAVALNLAQKVAAYQPDGAVAIFSLEMSAEQLGMRFLSAASHIAGDKLRTGRLSENDWQQVNEAASVLRSAKIYVDDASMNKMSDLFSKCRRLKSEVGLNLVVVDYIQMFTSGSSENRQQEVAEYSRSLKALARELKVPVLALSQLSRNVEQRENKHPMLSDLRESGAIEQDADVVMMLYREAYYDDELREQAQEAGTEKLEINIAKHRNGATKKVYVAFEGSTNALYNIAPQSNN